MDFSTRLKGLLDPSILGGIFDGSPDETLSRFLPTDQIDRIPEGQRDWYAREALRATHDSGRPAAQQRLLDFAKLREGQTEAAQKARELQEQRAKAAYLLNPGQQALDAQALMGGSGPTKLAASIMNSPELRRNTMTQAAILESQGGPKIVDTLLKLNTPVDVKPGWSMNPMTGQIDHRVELEKGLTLLPNGTVGHAPGVLESLKKIEEQRADIDVDKTYRTTPDTWVQRPDGSQVRMSMLPPRQPLSAQGYQQPQASGQSAQVPGLVSGNMPQVGRPGAMPPQAAQGDLIAQRDAAVVAGRPADVLRLEKMLYGDQYGQSKSYDNALQIQRDIATTNNKTSTEQMVRTAMASFESARNAAGSIPEISAMIGLIDKGVYGKQGFIPGDWRLAWARQFGGDTAKIADTTELRQLAVKSLLDMAQKVKPISDSDMKTLKEASVAPDTLSEAELGRIARRMLKSAQGEITRHGEDMKRFPAEKLRSAIDFDLSVVDPTPAPKPLAPSKPAGGGLPPGFVMREVKR